MKILPFTQKELEYMQRNAIDNYEKVCQAIQRENKEYLTQENHTIKEQHYDILNRYHQQCMLYCNQARKYSQWLREMYGQL
mgnify:CR=1 FL=1